MNSSNRIFGRASFAAALLSLSLLAAGCGEEPPSACLGASPVDPAAPVTRIGVHFTAGGAPLELGRELTLSSGATAKPSKARFIVSQVALLGPGGERVAAELVDDAGAPLKYGLTLLDLERPESLGLSIRAPAGDYAGLALSVGVPERCPSGEALNHVDAAEMEAPLDVDSDMYWSWDPGYVFLKFEGQVRTPGGWEGFFFHVGEEARFASLELAAPFTLSVEGGSGPELIADFDRLLVSPAGAAQPNIHDEEERQVHGGEPADHLAENIRGSGFLRLAEGHR